jgi:hypothetical protein
VKSPIQRCPTNETAGAVMCEGGSLPSFGREGKTEDKGTAGRDRFSGTCGKLPEYRFVD